MGRPQDVTNNTEDEEVSVNNQESDPGILFDILQKCKISFERLRLRLLNSNFNTKH
jgi:hypothetical protein